ncbi:hypothetical protein V9T40_007443 [Parthenolecanium corni]|uniref:NOPS domain-containing protein n=1 Tax=Parthenolecanium corni TaxID=536013 RepID=A0AAN9YC03_9HEMI
MRYGRKEDFEFLFDRYTNTVAVNPDKYEYLKSLFCYPEEEEINRKMATTAALIQITESCAKCHGPEAEPEPALRPVVVEPYDVIDDVDGFPEKSITRKPNDYMKSREAQQMNNRMDIDRNIPPGGFEQAWISEKGLSGITVIDPMAGLKTVAQPKNPFYDSLVSPRKSCALLLKVEVLYVLTMYMHDFLHVACATPALPMSHVAYDATPMRKPWPMGTNYQYHLSKLHPCVKFQLNRKGLAERK